MSHTPSDTEGLWEEIEEHIERYRRFLTDQNSGDEYHTSELIDDIAALISQKIIEARLDEMKRTAKYAGAWMNPSSGERTVNWVNMEVINSRITELEATLTTKQDTKEDL